MSDPRDADFEKALALRQAGRVAEAVEVLGALAAGAVSLKVAGELGRSLAALGRYDEAQHWLGLAVGHRPTPGLRKAYGEVLAAQGRTDLAEAEFRAALAQVPDHDALRLALAGLLLSEGRYAEGWPLLEARVRLHPATVPPVEAPWPEWTGQDLAGQRVLVWYEQGLGDQIQMCRFAADLKERGAAWVTLGCRAPLTALLATCPGVDAVIDVPQGGAATVEPHDLWTRYFSLPLHLGVTLETLRNAPYLSAPEDRRGRPAPRARVGLAWKASPTGFNAAHKGLPPEEAERLFKLGVMSLDPADTGVADFADTAAIIEQLDLVISIDTSVAHLAGAMGRPVWTLLPRVNTDWRWLRNRRDSPWYPTMTLYRQADPGDWGLIVSAVIRDLQEAGLARA